MNKSENLLFALLLLAIPAFTLAQCPPAVEDGLHVVQADETLSSIGRLYGVPAAQLSAWNNITSGELLQPCRELVVSSRLENPVPAVVGGVSINSRQAGNWHTVRPGETVESLADLYGYTARRFREFNQLEDWRMLNAGSVVRSTECACNRLAVTARSANPGPTLASTPVSLGPAFNAPEVVATDRANMKVSESRMIDAINQLRADPPGFIAEVNAFVAKENKKAWRRKPINPTAVSTLVQRLARTPGLSVLRAHPCLYQVAKTHGEYLKATNQIRHDNARNEYSYSRARNACPTLSTGVTQLSNGTTVGNENLVAGYSPLEAVIYLLIDEGTPGYRHRETLLAPEWLYVTTYNFGRVKGQENNFVQMFGH